MTFFGKAMVATVLTLGASPFSASHAMARIVCGGESGVCWHVQEDYDYPASAGIVVHPDAWNWGAGANYRWREHDGRGYWNGDNWTAF